VNSITLGHLGVSFTIEYDDLGNLKRDFTVGNNGGLPPFYSNVTEITLVDGQHSQNNPEAEANFSAILSVPYRDANYLFDPGGNRTSTTIKTYEGDPGAVTNFTYNAASQLVTESGAQNVTHEYDVWGNESIRTTGNIREDYSYNYLNILSSYIKNRHCARSGCRAVELAVSVVAGR